MPKMEAQTHHFRKAQSLPDRYIQVERMYFPEFTRTVRGRETLAGEKQQERRG